MKSAFSKISEIGPDIGKSRLERVSAISRYFACAKVLNQNQEISANLAPNQQDRADFVRAVGDVISIGTDWLYTPDFKFREFKKDYAVGNNFLTTQVSSSKGRTIDYPKRPAPLLLLDNQSASLHPDHQTNLTEKYEWNKISAAFGIWLCRYDDIGQADDTVSIAASINSLNTGRFGTSVTNLITVNERDLQELKDAKDPITNTEMPNTSNFGQDEQKKAEIGPPKSTPEARIGVNHLFYGAPATGKSTKVDNLAGKKNVTRTVFHPDTQNSDFFGSLKPRMHGDKIEYAFAAGPFSQALREALRLGNEHHFLIIEELNRAPAAAVFGELFQLLDRAHETDQDRDLICGQSSYSIAFPSPESEAWFNEGGDLNLHRLFIPNNLTIYATMNSADQGVFPLDTAFRRRWTQEYLPLYSESPPVGSLDVRVSTNTEQTILWDKFVRKLNEFLIKKFDAAEDRLLGHWFARPHELGSGVPEKILLYLWDDLLRHEDRFLLFNKAAGKTYGQLHQASANGVPIFSNLFLTELADQTDDVAG